MIKKVLSNNLVKELAIVFLIILSIYYLVPVVLEIGRYIGSFLRFLYVIAYKMAMSL